MRRYSSDDRYSLFPQAEAFDLDQILEELIATGTVRFGGDAPSIMPTVSPTKAHNEADGRGSTKTPRNNMTPLAARISRLLAVDLAVDGHTHDRLKASDILNFHRVERAQGALRRKFV